MRKVSVIVPVYNAEKTISKCIESILNQTHKVTEILLINDGSTDKSIQILKEYEKKYKFINIIDKENEGVAVTRNLGIKKSVADYIMFVDNDDYLENRYIENYIKELKNNDYDIIIGGYKRIDQNGRKLYSQILHRDTEWAKYIILTPWARIYKKSFLIDNKIEFLSYKIGEDVYFNLLAYSKKPNVKIINNSEYIWTYNTESVSNTVHKGLNKSIDIIYLLDKISSFSDLSNIYIRYFLRKFCIWYLLYSGKNANQKEFLNESKKMKIWLESKGIYKTISPFSFELSGETLKNRLIVLIFSLIERMNLVKLFAKFYCKGK